MGWESSPPRISNSLHDLKYLVLNSLESELQNTRVSTVMQWGWWKGLLHPASLALWGPTLAPQDTRDSGAAADRRFFRFFIIRGEVNPRRVSGPVGCDPSQLVGRAGHHMPRFPSLLSPRSHHHSADSASNLRSWRTSLIASMVLITLQEWMGTINKTQMGRISCRSAAPRGL